MHLEKPIPWFWMAQYCYKRRWNPHDAYFWELAKEAYLKAHPESNTK